MSPNTTKNHHRRPPPPAGPAVGPAQLYEAACRQARADKEANAAAPLPVGLAVWRGGQEVARITLDQGASEQMRSVVHLATLSLSADRLCLVFEGWQANVMVNPATGTGWQAGEIGAYADAHGVDETVGEAVVVHVATASEQVRCGALPFTVAGGRVTWGEATQMDHAAGAVPEIITAALSQASAAPGLLARLERHPVTAGRSDTWKRAVVDTMAAAALTGTYGAKVSLLAGEDQVERRGLISAYAGADEDDRA